MKDGRQAGVVATTAMAAEVAVLQTFQELLQPGKVFF